MPLPSSSASVGSGGSGPGPDPPASGGAPASDALPVSVVIVAHARRAYLAQALRSVERQTLPRREFEVVLLKDFDAPEIEPEIARLGATVVDLPPGPLGTWIAQARPRLRGELVAFLDDDDAFVPEKLARVVADFQAAPAAAYLRHATRTLAGPTTPDAPNGAFHATGGPRVVLPSEWRREFRRWWDADIAFNLSSMVVRAEVLDPFPELLSRIQVSLSTFLFCAALRMESPLLVESEALSVYRRAEGVGPSGAPAPRTARRLSELARPRADDARTLLELLAPLRLPAAEAPMRAALARGTLVDALEGSPATRGSILHALGRSARYRPWRALLAERIILEDALAFLVSPPRARAAWGRHRQGDATPPGGRP
jgi:Glycosyl transferase family 2